MLNSTVEVRASLVHDMMQLIQELAEWPRIAEIMEPEVLDTALHCGRIGWIPLQIDIKVSHAVAEVIGLSAMAGLGLDIVLRTTKTPLLKPILEGAQKIFRVNPKGGIRLMSRTVHTLYRPMGKAKFREQGLSSASLLWSQIPQMMIENPPWLESYRGGLYIFFDVCGVEGEVKMETGTTAEGPFIQFDFSW